MRRLTRPLFVTIAAAISAAFAFEWALLPSRLEGGAVVSQLVHASYLPGRGGYAHLRARDGGEVQISCGRVEALCIRLRRAPIPQLAVRLVRVGALDAPWLLSARVGGTDVVAAAEAEQRHARSRAIHASLAVLFGLAAGALWRWLPGTKAA